MNSTLSSLSKRSSSSFCFLKCFVAFTAGLSFDSLTSSTFGLDTSGDFGVSGSVSSILGSGVLSGEGEDSCSVFSTTTLFLIRCIIDSRSIFTSPRLSTILTAFFSGKSNSNCCLSCGTGLCFKISMFIYINAI